LKKKIKISKLPIDCRFRRICERSWTKPSWKDYLKQDIYLCSKERSLKTNNINYFPKLSIVLSIKYSEQENRISSSQYTKLKWSLEKTILNEFLLYYSFINVKTLRACWVPLQTFPLRRALWSNPRRREFLSFPSRSEEDLERLVTIIAEKRRRRDFTLTTKVSGFVIGFGGNQYLISVHFLY
jgi:hypothetical protein